MCVRIVGLYYVCVNCGIVLCVWELWDCIMCVGIVGLHSMYRLECGKVIPGNWGLHCVLLFYHCGQFRAAIF